MDVRSLATQGLSDVAIATRLSLDRGTVAKYRDVESRPARCGAGRPSKAEPFETYIRGRLELYPELQSETIFDELVKQGYSGCRRSLRRFIEELRGSGAFAKRRYKPFETLPGQQAQCDWGHCGTIEHGGVTRKLYAFVMVLGYSRMRYVEFTVSQNTTTFLQCHQRAFDYFGGVPHEVVYDNCKTVVMERIGSVVQFNQALLAFAGYYRTKPRACWAYDPETKGKVEAQVKYVKRGFLYGREYSGLVDLNQQRWDWLEAANRKAHGTTGEPPATRLQQESVLLVPLPHTHMEVKAVVFRIVSKDQLIRLEGNSYSAPPEVVGKKVTVRITDEVVEIHSGDSRLLLATHERCWGRRERVLQDDHYSGHDMPRRERRPSLQVRFEGLCVAAPDYLRGLANSGGSLKDHVCKIVAMAPGYSPEEMQAAMTRAASFKAYGYGILRRILDRRLFALDQASGNLPDCLNTATDIPHIDVEQRDLTSYSYGGDER
jgi:transposase